MSNQDTSFEKLVEVLESNVEVVVLAGAGISKAAGVPLGGEIVNGLQNRYEDKFDEDREYTYEEAWKTALPGQENREERRAFFEELIGGTSPTEEHHRLAQLADEGVCRTVLTTNFDHLLEIAFNCVCRRNHRIFQYDSQLSVESLKSDVPKVIKIHGDYLFRDIANLESEMRARVERNMRAQLLEYLEDKALIVTGYSGNDTSVMRLLQECAETDRGLAGGVYWTTYSDIDLEDEDNREIRRLMKTLETNGKNTELIGPTGSAEFLEGISEELGIGKPEVAPFGVDKLNFHVINTYNSTYGQVQHTPPTYDVDIGGDVENAVEIVYNHIIAGGIWSVGGVSGWDWGEFVNLLYQEFSREECFYFNPEYSEDITGSNLMGHLLDFADRMGCEFRQHTSWFGVLRELFSEDATVIIDQFSGGIQANLQKAVKTVIYAKETTEDGTLVILQPSQDSNLRVQQLTGEPDEIISRLHNGQINDEEIERINWSGLEIDVPKVKERINRLDVDSKELLWLIGYLRRAEFPANLLPRIDASKGDLEVLEQEGLVQSMQDRIYPHPVVQQQRPSNRAHKFHRILGETFNELATEQEVRVVTHAIEAEKHLWDAGMYVDGFNTILKLSNGNIRKSHTLFLYRTLTDYFQRAADGAAFFDDLSVAEQIRSMVNYYNIWQDLDNLVDGYPEGLQETELRYLPQWQKSYRKVYNMLLETNEGADLTTIEDLVDRISDLGDGLDPNLRGDLKYQVSQLYRRHLETLPPNERSDLIESRIEWLKRAKEDYEITGREVGVARCLDSIAGSLIEQGEFDRAEEFAKQERDKLVYEPGLSEDRAVVYGNLYSICLRRAVEMSGKDRRENLKKAEGYFFESNLNYIGQSQTEGVMKNISTLFYGAAKLEASNSNLVPSPRDVYHYCHLVWLRDPALRRYLLETVMMVHHQYVAQENNPEALKEIAPVSEAIASDLKDRGDVRPDLEIRFTVIHLAHRLIDDDQNRKSITQAMTPQDEDGQAIVNWFKQRLSGKKEPLSNRIEDTTYEEFEQEIENLASDIINAFDSH